MNATRSATSPSRAAGRYRMPARRGITFVEVLATMLLMAIVLPVAMKGISLCTNAASNARERIEIASMAESRLAEIVVSGDWRVGAMRGPLHPDQPEYEWTLEVREWPEGGLQELTLHVEDVTTRRTIVSLTTLARRGGGL